MISIIRGSFVDIIFMILLDPAEGIALSVALCGARRPARDILIDNLFYSWRVGLLLLFDVLFHALHLAFLVQFLMLD